MKPRYIALIIIAAALAAIVALTGCESLKDATWALDVAQGDTTMSVNYGSGKAVIEAEQGNDKVRFSGRQ